MELVSNSEFEKINFQLISNGEIIAYRKIINDSSNINLILIHGMQLSSNGVFDYLVQYLRKYKYNIYALDLRGCGDSSLVKPVKKFDDMAEDIKLFIDELNLKENVLIGLSMGGFVSMKFAANYPEYIKKLILLSAPSCQGITVYYEEENPDTKEKILKVARKKKTILKSDFSLILKTCIKKDVDTLTELYTKFYCNGKKQLNSDIIYKCAENGSKMRNALECCKLSLNYNITNEVKNGKQGTNQLENIKCKVLIIHGDQDLVLPLFHPEKNFEMFGNLAKLVVLKGEGHLVVLSEPEEISNIIINFITK